MLKNPFFVNRGPFSILHILKECELDIKANGGKFNLNDVDLYIGNAQILENGNLNKYDPQKVTDYIKSRMKGRYLVDDIVKIMINLNSGESKGTAWGCDLSKKYVEINSEYTT